MSDAHNTEFLFFNKPQADDKFWAIADYYLIDEQKLVKRLLTQSQQFEFSGEVIANQAAELVQQLRCDSSASHEMDSFLVEYRLSTKEGIMLMCLAEALLRIPDAETAERLIKDKLESGDWEAHLQHSDSWLVNATSWGLVLTGRLVDFDEGEAQGLNATIQRMVRNSGESVVRQAMYQAMKLMGRQFVMGENIASAFKRSRQGKNLDSRYSFDMLGEAAVTSDDAERYFNAYKDAIETLSAAPEVRVKSMYSRPSVSIKLSALHPRYQVSQMERVMTELRGRLLDLAVLAKRKNITLTIDAEESERLMMSLLLFESVFVDPKLSGWDGLGLALQAYQKRACAVIDWLAELADKTGKRISIRLIKGAYWDTEIKHAQERGLDGYPVFTRKQHTDLSYQVCALKLLQNRKAFYPQFATHNAYSIEFILAQTSKINGFEFQRLHGMGEGLYQKIVRQHEKRFLNCRVYAPVGSHQELLPYLVRRLLENGANSSFVNRVYDREVAVASLVQDPVLHSLRHQGMPHPAIPLPKDIFAGERENSRGFNWHDETELHNYGLLLDSYRGNQWQARPLINGQPRETMSMPLVSPFDRHNLAGQVHPAKEAMVDEALQLAQAAYRDWSQRPVRQRADKLRQLAALLEHNSEECYALLSLEAGKTLMDCVAEVREAVDFCHYYAMQAERLMASRQQLAGPTGEQNMLYLSGRGPFVCISPWNFPLAIFVGQIAAALVCGNPVVAKPAEQTPLIGAFAVKLMHQAGIPVDVIQLLPGDGAEIGGALVRHPAVKGVVFTGSMETARMINLAIAQRERDIIPLIAETGGMNAMIVDSSALPEQVVGDIISSAFDSAGQRCSALRVLYLQQDVADKIIPLLTGAMQQLKLGDPGCYATDVGPVIDSEARMRLEQHIDTMKQQAKLVYQLELPESAASGCFVAPCCFEIEHISQLTQEVFGPVLHIIRYAQHDLDKVIADINATGYGLTLGIHSRIESTVEQIVTQVHIGNMYVNRNMVGAVVGVQPFGGEGLSGTGPKAGGPHYLYRFCTEHAISTNVAAVGGNASLLSLLDE